MSKVTKWLTDEEMMEIVGEGWCFDLDLSHSGFQTDYKAMLGYAQRWLRSEEHTSELQSH